MQYLHKFTLAVEDTFSAAHHIPKHEKCGNVHGHTWKVRVELSTVMKLNDAEIIVDFGDIKEIIAQYDHQYLNNVMGFPSAERIAARLYRTIRAAFPRCSIVVTVWESEDTSVRVEAAYEQEQEL